MKRVPSKFHRPKKPYAVIIFFLIVIAALIIIF